MKKQILTNELREFEALLDYNEQYENTFSSAKNILARRDIVSLSHKEYFDGHNLKIMMSPNNKHLKDNIKLKAKEQKANNYKKNVFPDTLGSIPDIKEDFDTLFNIKERPKTNIPGINITRPKIDRSKKSLGFKDENLYDKNSSLRNSNREIQKASYNEFLSLFKESTSTNPTKVFDESSTTSFRDEKDATTTLRIETDAQVLQSKFWNNRFIFQKHDNNQNDKPGQDETIIKDAKKTVEQLVRAVQINPVNNYIQSMKYESQKMEQNNWREVIIREHPAKIEIVIIDIINFAILKKVEIVLKSLFSQDIGGTINETIIEIIGTENEAKHVLVYFHEKKGIRKIFLSKFFFVVKNNLSFINGLKTEKEIIMYYLVILGIFQFRLKYEDKPVSESKVNGVKAKALNIVKGLDQSSSPHLSQWLCHTIRPEIYVEKFYINQNIKGRIDVNFMFNFPEYLKSTSSKFLLTNYQKSLVLDKTNSHSTSTSKMQPSQSNVSNSSSSDSWPKGFALSPKTSSGILNHFNPLIGVQTRPKLFLDPLLGENFSDTKRKLNRHFSRSTQNTPKMNSSEQIPIRSSLKSLTYLSSDKAPAFFYSQGKTFTKSPILPSEAEFTNLNITTPIITSPRLHNFLKKTAFNQTSNAR